MKEIEENKITFDDDNTQGHRSSYKKFLIFLCWIVYTFAQLGRYSYSSNITLIMDKFSVNHEQASLPTTFFFFCYGAGQIINAFLCRKYHRKYVLTIALLGSAIINATIYFKINFAFVKYLWALNGLLQSTLWVLLLLSLGEELDKKRSVVAAFVMSTASTGGTFLSYGISALISLTGKFEYTFILTSILLLIVAFMWLIFYKPVKRVKAENDLPQKNSATEKEVPKNFVFMISLFAFFVVVAYAIGGGLKSWMPSILKETFFLADWISIFLSVLLPFCSIFNATISTFCYKKLKDFILLNIIFFAITCILIVPTMLFLKVSWILTLVLIILLCMSTGVITNNLTVQVPLLLKNKKFNSGLLAGLLNGFAYLGSAVSTYVLGIIADRSEWNSIFVLFIILSLVCLVLGIVYYIMRSRKKQNLTERAQED